SPPLTVAKLSPTTTATGAVLQGALPGQSSGPVVVPIPSSPSPLYPQQYAAPLVAMPQACVPKGLEPPAAALTSAKIDPPVTTAGTELLVVVPFPSSPLALSPQQYAAPLVVMPQVCRKPALNRTNWITVTVISAV